MGAAVGVERSPQSDPRVMMLDVLEVAGDCEN